MPVDSCIANTIRFHLNSSTNKSYAECCVAVASRELRFYRMEFNEVMGNVLSLTGNEHSSLGKGCFTFTFIRHKHLFAPPPPPLSLFGFDDVTRCHFYDNILSAEHTDNVDSDGAICMAITFVVTQKTEPNIHMKFNSKHMEVAASGTNVLRDDRVC